MSTLSPIDNKANIQTVKQAAAKVYGDNQVLIDLTVAQAILESNLLGKKPSQLALKYNNLFGIKGQGTKGTVILNTQEESHGVKSTVKQPFAVNNSIEDSIAQRKALFENGTKDKPSRYHAVLEAKTFEDAAHAVVAGGYATDSSYAQQLIGIYNKYLRGN